MQCLMIILLDSILLTSPVLASPRPVNDNIITENRILAMAQSNKLGMQLIREQRHESWYFTGYTYLLKVMATRDGPSH